jgi:hypothetical protein
MSHKLQLSISCTQYHAQNCTVSRPGGLWLAHVQNVADPQRLEQLCPRGVIVGPEKQEAWEDLRGHGTGNGGLGVARGHQAVAANRAWLASQVLRPNNSPLITSCCYFILKEQLIGIKAHLHRDSAHR